MKKGDPTAMSSVVVEGTVGEDVDQVDVDRGGSAKEEEGVVKIVMMRSRDLVV